MQYGEASIALACWPQTRRSESCPRLRRASIGHQFFVNIRNGRMRSFRRALTASCGARASKPRLLTKTADHGATRMVADVFANRQETANLRPLMTVRTDYRLVFALGCGGLIGDLPPVIVPGLVHFGPVALMSRLRPICRFKQKSFVAVLRLDRRCCEAKA